MPLKTKHKKALSRVERLALLPASLEIYLTGACNLSCDYCSSRPLLKAPAKKLAWPQVQRAIDLFASYTDPAGAGRGDTKFRVIGLTGGEPLLEFDLAARAVEHIRRRYKWLSVTLSTNGTLLDREKAEFLLARDVDLTVSLDGPQSATDAHRRFAAGKGSVYARVMANLAKLPKELLGQMRVMATFSPETAPLLAESVAFLNKFGFAAIEADFDMYGLWPARDLARLRGALAGLRRFYLKRFDYGGWTSDWGSVFGGALQNKVANTGRYDAFNEFALSNEGIFYPADVAALFGRRSFKTGDLAGGVDFARLEGFYRRAIDYLGGRGWTESVVPPACRYFYALARGLDADTFMGNAAAMKRIFDEELGGLLAMERVFRRLARNKDFGDFAHEPPRRSRAAVGAAVLDAAAGLGQARRAADWLLYSPGAGKTLNLSAAAGPAFERAQGVMLYSVLKAAYLKKKLRVSLEPRASGRCAA